MGVAKFSTRVPTRTEETPRPASVVFDTIPFPSPNCCPPLLHKTHRRCEFAGCTKWPLYAFEGEKAKYCSQHKVSLPGVGIRFDPKCGLLVIGIFFHERAQDKEVRFFVNQEWLVYTIFFNRRVGAMLFM